MPVFQKRANGTVHTGGTPDPGVDEAEAEWVTSVLVANLRGPV